MGAGDKPRVNSEKFRTKNNLMTRYAQEYELRANKEKMENLSMDRCAENVIEFLENQQQATVTFSQGRYKTRIRKLAEARPEECQIVAENKDGSICAHIPTTWVRIAPPPVRTEAQREASRRNALKLPRAGREKG